MDGAWRIALRALPIRPDTREIPIGQAGGPTPNIELPFGFPPDTAAVRAYQLRIDGFSFGPADQPNGLFHGVMMDSAFQRAIGKVTGVTASCLTKSDPGSQWGWDTVFISLPPETAWVDTRAPRPASVSTSP